jgi:phosphomannomutase
VSDILFGTDGWRAIIAEDFTFENVRKVVHAIARYAVRAEKPGAGILVGYDTRFGSDRFARAAAETVSAAGIPVWLASEAAPTPALSLLVKLRGAAGGIQITASHNPRFRRAPTCFIRSMCARRIWKLSTLWWIGIGCAPRNSAS